MEGVKLINKDYREIDAEGYAIIECQDGPHRLPGQDGPQQPAFFDFKCPRRGDHCGYLRILGGPADDGKLPTWQWNGDRVNPTMQPSINCLSHNPSNPTEKYAGCGWHGWITNGVAADA